MELNGRFEYKKALILTPERMKELEQILFKYCNSISYEAKTVSDTNISFVSLDELLGYDNFQNRRIKSLTVTGRNELDRTISCTFEAERLTLFTRYDETCICRYSVSNVEIETTLRDAIFTFLQKATASFWPISKFSLLGFLGFLSLYIFIPMIIFFRVDILSDSPISKGIIVILISMLASFLFIKLTQFFDNIFLEKVFPPITFLWGEEETRCKKNSEIIKNVFWCVVLPGICGIIGFFINKYFPK